MASKTTAMFVKEVLEVHGDTYSLDKVSYVSSKHKVVLTCKDHGEFLIRPINLLAGRGCKKCGVLKCSRQAIKTFASFVERANKRHGGIYDYHEDSYINTATKTTVTCPVHGDFNVLPGNHLSGQDYRLCALMKRRSNKEKFIELSSAIHKNKYDYSRVVYTLSKNKVIVVCPDHGEFHQVAASHQQGYGCPNCPRSGFNPSIAGSLYVLQGGGRTSQKWG